MFDEIAYNWNRSKVVFCNSVKDSFGYSIEKEMYDSVCNEISGLQRGYEEAELKKKEIQMLTLELRMIL